MPVYRLMYLKDEAAVDRFRSQPPPDGTTSIKAKDYVPAGEIEAPNEYAAWRMLQGEGAAERGIRPMGVGDVLEREAGDIQANSASRFAGHPRVCRFAGFDNAAWFVFEPRAKKGGTEAALAEEVSAEAELQTTMSN